MGAERENPEAKKGIVRLSRLIFKLEDGTLRISLKSRHFISIRLTLGEYQRKFIEGLKLGRYRLGEILLIEDCIIIPFKQEINFTQPKGVVALDVNERELTAVDDKGNRYSFNLSEAKRLHDTYFKKRKRIQQKIRKGEVKAKILAKYCGKEKRRVNDVLHKISKKVVDTFIGKGLIMEDLKGIRKRINYGRKLMVENSTVDFIHGILGNCSSTSTIKLI